MLKTNTTEIWVSQTGFFRGASVIPILNYSVGSTRLTSGPLTVQFVNMR